MIVIQGAGIVGLTLANCLQQAGLPWLLVERATELTPAGAGIGLQPNAHWILAQLGLAAALRQHGCPVRGIHIGPWQRPRYLSFPDPGSSTEQAGFILGVHRGDLHTMLLAALPASNIRLGASVAQWRRETEGVELRLTDGERLRVTHLIAADGLHSAVREGLYGLDDLRASRQWCWRTVVAGQPLGEDAAEWFCGSHRLGVVPIGGGRTYLYRVSSDIDDGRELPHPDAEDFDRFGVQAGQLVARLPPDAAWLSHPLVDRPARWGFGPLILVGDAAHPVTPNLGQGAAIGMEDAWVLSRLLLANVADAKRLAALRDARVRAVRRESWRAGQVAHWQSTWARRIRDGVLARVPEAAFVRAQLRQSQHFAPGPSLHARCS